MDKSPFFLSLPLQPQADHSAAQLLFVWLKGWEEEHVAVQSTFPRLCVMVCERVFGIFSPVPRLALPSPLGLNVACRNPAKLLLAARSALAQSVPINF